MDRRKLHERIAESFEPEPDFVPAFGARFFIREHTQHWDWAGLSVTPSGWRARDYDADESANAMLLDAMLDAGKHVSYIKQANGQMCLWLPEDAQYLAANRRLCNVAAFAAWKGLADEG